MSSPNKGSAKAPVFPVGPAGRRELKRALVRSTDPSDTIQKFQQSHSLHSMMARAFGTTPRHEAGQKANNNVPKDHSEEKEDGRTPVETLDTDSALTFLSHLGVSQHEIHKRIADTLLKQLEGEVRKTQSEGPLLDLLKSCWVYCTTVPELRPVLWAVLKQLGNRTPAAVLKALAEQDESGELRHAEIFRPLPPLLKRLVWETDWEDKVPLEMVEKSEPKKFLDSVESTLLSQTILPHLQHYCSNEYLVHHANRPFVATVRERKLLTTQRRALTTVSTTTAAAASVTGASNAAAPAAVPGSTSPTRGSSKLSSLTSGGSQAATAATSTSLESMTSGKSIAAVRQLLSDTSGGTASASFRPKLLYAVLSMLIAKHGSMEDNLLGCADHLHCTLVADLLLSASGLPKAYQHVLRLATVLDDSVRAGILADTGIVKIQGCLKGIFPADESDQDDKAFVSKKKKEESTPGKAAHDPLKEPSTAFKRQLNRIISASLTAMKDADPQNLFLNPVTDEIAPGYSKVIKHPMCIMAMEEKIDDFEYTTLQEWEDDVKLMFQNCITYNRGAAGQWFRGEAQRQGKVFKDEILPQARRLYQKEVALRTQKEDIVSKKRKYPGEDGDGEGSAATHVVPLPAVYKKTQRKAPAKPAALEKNAEEKGTTHIPSMPAIASMLLADPFVVRLLLDRVLRSIRLDVTRGRSLPTGHTVIPSLLQLLHMAQWSNQVCAVRGNQYVVPDAGVSPPSSDNIAPEEYLMRAIPYESLRRFMPLLSQLLLENELDQRVVHGGELYDALNSIMDGRPKPPAPELWRTSNNIQAIIGLVEGALVHICRPGNANENSLSVTYPKFAKALEEISNDLCDDRAFFLCLIESLLRHKSKLNRNTRDVVVTHWLTILQKPPKKRRKVLKKRKKWGTMTSAAHECLILLLNEWAALGNLLLPRDMLLKFSSRAVQAADASETLPERKFSALWLSEKKAEEEVFAGGDFEPIRKQYGRLLESLPENYRTQWKEQVGIADALMKDTIKEEDADKNTEGDTEAKMKPGDGTENDGTLKTEGISSKDEVTVNEKAEPEKEEQGEGN